MATILSPSNKAYVSATIIITATATPTTKCNYFIRFVAITYKILWLV